MTMSDPYQPITHVQKYLDQNITLDVSVRFEFNNLIMVNELDNTVSLDFFYRLWWQDVRWNLTKEFWNEVPLSVYYDIEMYSYLFESENALPMWRPDLHFIDIFDINEEAGLFKLRPEGQIYWSRHIIATILQPDFDLSHYPNDNQDIVLTFESYGLTQGVMGLVFTDPPVGYVIDINKDIVFSKNPIWYHREDEYETAVFVNDYTNIPEFPRLFVVLQLSLRIQRAGRGILVRFALPILILLLLSAATFWADFNSRIDTTMTVLLSVSALYVVIIEGIPQVGYLTTFDEWIFTMYTALAIFVILHQVVIVLKRKSKRVPIRNCVIRMIEFFGRILVAPMSMLYYMLTFMDPTLFIYVTFTVIMLLFIFLIGAREWGGLKKSFVEASEYIQDKIDEGRKVSKIEMMVMNLISFKKFSTSEAAYKAKLSRKERIRIDAARSIEMRQRTRSEAQVDSDDDDEI
eukprot:CAMPEP_0114413612 /NCGR_PEP_ID=MMETSP0103-20121206/948_1 /TAXON_ID=37642 ORGANISM="Paraphysomonas imperforata, Strain PA2" /NCGR_SAMPLE_ID=MMETSP0103 /ASSEMBLY_ACC=CAM_ASM_000201 /LENGTH=460 /DNA_ID=CAMNT_0001581699 /DNA_START=129 /DNA_END=1511 /DNA_ORIENTATION=+